MRVTDTPLYWVLASAALLACALVAVVVMSRRPRREEAGTRQGDSRERSEARRRRKEAFYATAAYMLLFCCAGVAAALSFHGLVGFGRQNLQLSGGWEYLVPFGLDGAAMFSAVIAVREASHGDASLGSRLLVWTFAGAAAWFNWVHAPRGVDHAGAPEFFAGMSLSAAILFDRALKQTRRAALREQGLVPRPLPQIRAVRWVRAPRETYRAWSLMLLEGVGSLDEAVDEARDERRRHDEERLRRKEQGRLERARVQAISRQQGVRGLGRVRGARRTEAAATTPAAAPAVAAGDPAAGQLPLRSRPALQAGDEQGTATAAFEPRQRTGEPRDIRRGTTGTGRYGTGTEETDEHADEHSVSGAANPRLDSLEEKLAEIERQFG